jgi:hypothetical protein
MATLHRVFVENLNTKHTAACFWRGNPCPANYAQPPLHSRDEALAYFRYRTRPTHNID